MRKSFLFLASLLLLLISSCSDKEPGMDGPSTNNGALSINLVIPGSAINTYASVDAIGGEDWVHTLYILFFEPSNDGSGKFLEIQDISPEDGGYYQSGQSFELKLPAESNISKSKAYNLLFLANPNYYLEMHGGVGRDWADFLSGMTEMEVKLLRMGILGYSGNEGDSDYYQYKPYEQDNLLMSGSFAKEASKETILAELTRDVARFDIKNEAGSEYKLVSASIWNGFPEQTVWDASFSDFSLERIKRLYGIKVTNDEVIGGLYAYENYVAVPEQNDKVSTCLILGIEHNGNTTYYRVNANQTGKNQQLKRNNVYTFTLLSVKGDGENSEEDAYNSTKNLLNVQINEWQVDDQGNIKYDGDNILAISSTNIIFNYMGGEREYKVFTAGEGTLIISQQELPSGFTVSLVDGILYVSATESQIDKAGYVELQFGKLKTTVNIKQIGEVEQFLEADPQQLPMFEALSENILSDIVTVTSSGPWTAKMYNDQNFFAFEDGSTEIKGYPDETFKVKILSKNTNVLARYAFVHVTLDENPQISGVVILSQNGMGGFTISPDVQDVEFDADGGQMSYPGDYNIEVTTDDENGEWTAALYGSHKDYFELERNGDVVTIKSKGINPETFVLNATVRIYLNDNPAIYEEIKVTQYAHSLSVDPNTFPIIATEGGATDYITVTSSTNWAAIITTTGNEAYFGTDETSKDITGTSGDIFKVTFPALTEGNVTPEAIVTVFIPNTNIKQTLVINQRQVQSPAINVQNATTLYGYLVNSNTNFYRTNYIEQFYQSMTNTDNFGINGQVFCGGFNFLLTDLLPYEETDIFVLNSFNAGTEYLTKIRTWLDASPNRLILAFSDDRSNTLVTGLGFTGYTATGGTGNNVVKTDIPRSINTNDNYTMDNNPLYDYLFRSGPFTKDGDPIQKDQIKLLPYDASNNALTAWAPTMIPLILDPHDPTRLILGIDPTLKFVYTGEMDLFGTNGVSSISYTEDGVVYTGVHNYSYGPYSENNLKFLNNLIAWIVNATMYGEEFTNQFK